MTKKEFARRAMEIVEICIEKGIGFLFLNAKLEIFTNKKYPFLEGSQKITYFQWGAECCNKDLTEMKKLVEEHEG